MLVIGRLLPGCVDAALRKRRTAYFEPGPASFAGTSRIRFRGSVALPHSQRACAPRRRSSVARMVPQRRSAPGNVHPADALANPVDDIADDLRPLRLVVHFVPEARVDLPCDAGPAFEDRTRLGRDDGIDAAMDDQGGQPEPIEARGDATLLGERRVGELDR